MRLLELGILLCILSICQHAMAGESALCPRIDGSWRTVAVSPDLGELTSPDQQPVDFGVWQAGDGTWQLWSCIRGTKCGGHTRLLHRWQSTHLTDGNWEPMGVAMQADAKLGETPGGLQAPFVTKYDDRYYMFYGDWENICSATSRTGKLFRRRVMPNGKTGMFSEGKDCNTRDPMVLRIGDTWYCYYTAYPNANGSVFCRTSKDLTTWSESKIVAYGGYAGTGKYSAECPFVVAHGSGYYYLFRTQHYGKDAQTCVYRSRDPLDFGVNDDKHLVCTLPVAAPEILEQNGSYYIACLLPSLKGIQIAPMSWAESTTVK